jgi:hypothetical protein
MLLELRASKTTCGAGLILRLAPCSAILTHSENSVQSSLHLMSLEMQSRPSCSIVPHVQLPSWLQCLLSQPRDAQQATHPLYSVVCTPWNPNPIAKPTSARPSSTILVASRHKR